MEAPTPTPAPASIPVLVAVSHGTADPTGQSRIEALVGAVRDRTPAPVKLAHVDVQTPRVGEVLAGLDGKRGAVVVPLLLSAGYHVKVDLRREAAGRPVAPALGPDERLVDVLVHRALAAGFVRGRHRVVLGAAGSTDAGAVAACRQVAARLSHRLGTEVTDAYLSAAHPTVPAAVGHLHRADPTRPVLVVSYLLAPGYFQSLLAAEAARAGAEVTTAPLLGASGPVPGGLAELVLERFAATVEGCSILGTTAPPPTASPC